MSYDSKLEGTLTLASFLAKNSSNKEVETDKNAKQYKVRDTIILPLNMHPNQETFESLGFDFFDAGDRVLINATLPEEWSTQRITGSNVLRENLIDDRGRIRGDYYYKRAYHDRDGHMKLCGRYRQIYQYTEPGNYSSPINVVAIDNVDGSVIFNAGQCEELYSKEYEELVTKAEEYLNSNYPGWKDVTKYWD